MSNNTNYIENGLNNNEAPKFKFPYEIKPVDPEINRQLLEDFTGEQTGFLQVGPKKWFLPSKYALEAENFYNFEVRPDDVWIVTYPRSGTTWTQEIVWLIENEFDYKKAAEVPLIQRSPFLEFSIFVHEKTKAMFIEENSACNYRRTILEGIDTPAWQILRDQPGKRVIKTHLPFSLLPPNLLKVGCKVIYIARNPKDIAVSFYHLNRLARTQGYLGDFPKFWDYFERDLCAWCPFWAHIEEGWERRREPNMLFLFYEEINKDLKSAIKNISNFLERTTTESQLETLIEHLKFDNFRKNKSVNFDLLKVVGMLKSGEQEFVRKGKNGSWREEFTPELNERADKWIAENLKNTDLRFPEFSRI